MIYEYDSDTGKILQHRSVWHPKELELERMILSDGGGESSTLNEAIFGEPLLLVSNQVRTRSRKRADILALDRNASGVIVELKRDAGSLGVETQALQYLADFSQAKGMAFIQRFSRSPEEMIERVRGFLGDGIRPEDINRNSRIILVAQAFDPALFSMGEWLAEHGVAFRCIAYTPVEIEKRRLLAFSWRFDRAHRSLFPVIFGSQIRQPGVFWHNIGAADNDWWSHLKAHQEITASFDCAPGDEGERILKSYVSGDTVLAYAKGFGAIGFAIVENPSGYKLLSPGDKDDVLNGQHLHRLPVKWKAVAPHLNEAITPKELRGTYDIYHPISTSVPVDAAKAKNLTKDMQNKWPHRAG